MGAVQKMAGGYRLKARGRAVGLDPADLFDKVNELMFKDPLQRFETGMALQAAHGDRPVPWTEAVEEQSAGDRDLEEHVAGIGSEPCGFAARFRHSCRQAKCETPAVQGPPALAVKKSRVVEVEQKREIL
jgi:hypothetical protein